MANPYTEVAISGYNSSPPPDDGSQIAANQLKWSNHTSKLGDPLKTAIETMNTNVNAAFATVDDASNLTTGTLPDARLSFDAAQIAFKDESNTFSDASPLVFSDDDPLIRSNADTKSVRILGGSANNLANGARISVFGTSDASSPGDVEIAAGTGGDVTVSGSSITLNGVDIDDYAQLSQNNEFTSSGATESTAPVALVAVTPYLWWRDTAAAADVGAWALGAEADGNFQLLARTDAGGTVETALVFTRTSSAVTSANFPNGTLRYGGEEVGFRRLVENAVTANYTADADDSGALIISATSGLTFTIPSHASVPYSRGTVLTFVNNRTSGDYTIAINDDTLTQAGTGSTGSRTLGPKGVATAIKVGNTAWLISGTGLS